jgi:hypothetical protein
MTDYGPHVVKTEHCGVVERHPKRGGKMNGII